MDDVGVYLPDSIRWFEGKVKVQTGAGREKLYALFSVGMDDFSPGEGLGGGTKKAEPCAGSAPWEERCAYSARPASSSMD